MGLTNRIIRLLDHGREIGVDYQQTLMIGRQQIHLSDPELRQTIDQCGIPNRDALADEIMSVDRYAEPLLRALGAQRVDSLDASDYEDANVIADLNQPLDESYDQQYSCVIDGGSLEHVFFFPTAIKNCMRLTRVGGHFISVNGTNNFSGHGFYQFSPELMYRVLSPENGFEVCDLLVWERTPGSVTYRAHDPADVHARVMAQTHHPTFMLVIARRTHEADIFSTTPMQSDYVVDWQKGEHRAPSATFVQPPLLKRIGKEAEKKVRAVRKRLFSRFHREHFEPFQYRKSA
ncbi:methyltransferase domain-containing protein [Stieleria varia]|uniref:Methyltransferase type 11 domain-containing protein n=1 Tax=Stieleria varia TaxID=2528005 RepID=A0A5C6AN63_9BACT|nr:hypothetical protein [Stieleria varia]TWU00851.1 hypothetical protein Pla52n_42200 [Stieleria varia]